MNSTYIFENQNTLYYNSIILITEVPMSIIKRLKKAAGSIVEENRRTKYAKYYIQLEIEKNVILYDSYFGRGLLCNPYAIFRQLITDKDFSDFIHVWVLEERVENEPVTEKYFNNKNILFVRRHSTDHLKYLASAGYVVTNVSLPQYYCKKPGQIYINTWHGTPIKSLGYDIPDSPATISNVIRNFLSADYILSANPFLTSVYLEKYKLQGLYQGKIIEEGYPRNDYLRNTDKSSVFDLLKKYGIDFDTKKQIILYAPTWKGNDYYHPEIDINEYIEFKRTLESQIDTESYQVLLKPHQAVYKALKNSEALSDTLIPAFIDTNELLCVTDVLISDYSSIFYDFLASGKPIIFYIPDLEKYKDYRGLYLEPKQLPGPALTSVNKVAEVINNIDEVINKYEEVYKQAKNFSCPYDDGNVSERIVDIIWKGHTTNANGRPYHIISCDNSIKKKVLFFGGGLRMNGISTALRTMVDLIDYDKFDVTVFGGRIQHRDSREMICTFHPNARVFASISKVPATRLEKLRSNLLRIFGFNFPLMKYVYPKKMYEREFVRCFGNSRFDSVVDYSGYGSFYSILLLSAKNAKKLIWQHNDLASDRQKRIGRFKKPHKRELRVVFSTYPFYDKIVGCSEDIMNINLEKIGYNDLKRKCCFVRNAANFARVIEGAEESFNETSAKDCGFPELLDSSLISFVNMGRLSPEKNQAALIQAFSLVYQKHPNIRLYIIGEGALREELDSLITTLELQGKVILTGNMDNPFMLMKECDCFILPSLYEGQPVSILEARLLKLPIIMSNFNSASSSLIHEGQLVIGNSITEIQQGMEAFLAGQVPTCSFDYRDYNNLTMKQFEEII